MEEKETLLNELESENYGLYSICSWLAEYHSGMLPPDVVLKREDVLNDLYEKFFPIRKSTLERIYDLWNSGNTNYVEDIKSIMLNDGDYERRYGLDNKKQFFDITESKGVGHSHYFKGLIEDSFVVDMGKESVESAIALIKSKDVSKKIVVIGCGDIGHTTRIPTIQTTNTIEKIKQLIKSEEVNNVTFLIEDIDKSFREERKKTFQSEPIVLKNYREPYDDYQVGLSERIGKKKTRKGINNRKIKKRKKAKNGRNKK